jgi:hypothetical protein
MLPHLSGPTYIFWALPDRERPLQGGPDNKLTGYILPFI